MKSLPSTLFGNSGTQRLLVRQLDQQTLGHALLFSGPSGVGKTVFATALGNTLLCLHPREERELLDRACKQCESCRMIRSGGHPDFLLIDCEEKTSNTDAVRELLYSLHLKPYGGAHRVVILRRADLLAKQALNVLLKAIEEPQPGTYFILTTIGRSRLLPTIVSRCQLYSFLPLTALEMSAVLEESHPETIERYSLEERRDLIELAAGSLERFRSFQEKLPLWRDVRKFVRACLIKNETNEVEAIRFAREVGDKEKQNPSGVFELLILACRHALAESTEEHEKAICSVTILNALHGERLVRERNLNLVYVLQLLFNELASHATDPFYEASDGLSQYIQP